MTKRYSQELADKICLIISTSSKGLRKICAENKDFPAPSVIYEWKLTIPEFAEQYRQAKTNQADYLIDEIVEISDNASDDIIIGPNGEPKPNTSAIARARLMCDTRKWIASKMIPKIYGDKVQSETTVTVISHEDALKALK